MRHTRCTALQGASHAHKPIAEQPTQPNHITQSKSVHLTRALPLTHDPLARRPSRIADELDRAAQCARLAWHGVARLIPGERGAAHGLVQHGAVRLDAVRLDAARLDAVGTALHGVVRRGAARCCVALHGAVLLCAAGCASASAVARRGAARRRLVRLCALQHCRAWRGTARAWRSTARSRHSTPCRPRDHHAHVLPVTRPRPMRRAPGPSCAWPAPCAHLNTHAASPDPGSPRVASAADCVVTV
jgi:hypothetical protein